MLFKRISGRQLVAALLLVIALVSAGTVPVAADSRCDDDYDHTHGWGWWRRTDAWQAHGYGTNPNNELYDHWTDHENSPKDWCDD